MEKRIIKVCHSSVASDMRNNKREPERFELQMLQPVYIKPLEYLLASLNVIVIDKRPHIYELLVPKISVRRLKVLLEYHYGGNAQLIAKPISVRLPILGIVR